MSDRRSDFGTVNRGDFIIPRRPVPTPQKLETASKPSQKPSFPNAYKLPPQAKPAPVIAKPAVAPTVHPVASKKPQFTPGQFSKLTTSPGHKPVPKTRGFDFAPIAPTVKKHRPTQQHHSAPKKPLFEAAIAAEKQKNGKKNNKKIQLAFIAAGILIFIIGAIVSLMSLRTNREVAAQAQTISQANSSDQDEGDNPSEEPITADTVSKYIVAPDLPRTISIPKLNVSARVLSLGVKNNNELKTPGNIYDAGWYNASAKPGQPGATLIDGHVRGATKPAVFSNLKKLVVGDTIVVEKGDGSKVTYKVVKTQVYDAEHTDMPAAMTPITNGKSGLNLITCNGAFDAKTSRYNERLIVFASQI